MVTDAAQVRPSPMPVQETPSAEIVSADGSPNRNVGPGFGRAVAPGGYAWWYLDALSDDGQAAITVIGFVGSVFSPYYALSGRREPANHCALNVAFYGRSRAWAMTERGRDALERGRDHLRIGPSRMDWDENGLTVEIRERGAPVPKKIEGRIRLHPVHENDRTFALDAAGRHIWKPICLRARVEVAMTHPAQTWSGTGYFDSNWGTEPLQRAFRRWDWFRGIAADGSVALVYDITSRENRGPDTLLCLKAAAGGPLREQAAPPRRALGPGPAWKVARAVRADGGTTPKRDTVLEDTPFYTRSEMDTRLFGQDLTLIHESMDLDRLASAWVPWLLPFRMPRRP